MLTIMHITYITFTSLGSAHYCKTVRGNVLTYLWMSKDLCPSKKTQDVLYHLEMEVLING